MGARHVAKHPHSANQCGAHRVTDLAQAHLRIIFLAFLYVLSMGYFIFIFFIFFFIFFFSLPSNLE